MNLTYPIVGAPSDLPRTAQDALGSSLTRVLARVVQVLSLSGESSVAHSVEAHRDGLRVTLDRGECERSVYAYVMPWARGWSCFVSEDANATNQGWRDSVGFSRRVNNPRDIVGPENVNADRLAYALVDAIEWMTANFTEVEDELEFFDGEDGDSGDCVFYNI